MLDFGLVNATADTLATPFSSLTRLVQALGGILIIYLAFSIANFVMNWKKSKEIKRMGKEIREIKNLLKKKRG